MAGRGDNINTRGNLNGKSKENMPLGKPKRRRDGLDWIDLAEDSE